MIIRVTVAYHFFLGEWNTKVEFMIVALLRNFRETSLSTESTAIS